MPILASLCTMAYLSIQAEAKETVVNNDTELQTALTGITEDTTIKFGEGMSKVTETVGDTRYRIKVDSEYNITIDGNNVNTRRGLVITDENEGDLLFKNLKIGGKAELPVGNMEVTINNSKGKFIIENSEFVYIRGHEAALDLIEGKGEVTIRETLFDGNANEYAGAILHFKSYRRAADRLPEMNLNIEKSTFSNNFRYDNYWGRSEVIYYQTEKNSLTINNSIFRNNKGDSPRPIIHFIDEYNNVDAPHTSYFSFENNIVEKNSGPIELESFTNNEKTKFINNSFIKNNGSSASGVSLFRYLGGCESILDVGTVLFEANTFFGEPEMKNNPAIDHNSSECPRSALKSEVTFNNNSFLYNGNKEDNNSSQVQTHLFNNLYFNNNLLVNNTSEKNVNIASESNVINNLSLGFDHLEPTTDTVEQVYGKYPVEPVENFGKSKAGRTVDEEIIKTLPIAPRMGKDIGIANEYAKNGTEYDQRGYKRVGKQDTGAVEISSIIYDGNGGKFTLPELTKYDGKTYYEGENPSKYAKVFEPGGKTTIVDAFKELKPVREGYTFLGWTDKANGTKPSAKYMTGTIVDVVDQQIIYAVWKKNDQKKYALTYFGNGKTSGVIPTQKPVLNTDTVTIKSQGKLKRKGYKFSGWSTKPAAKKGEAAYAPGKKLKLVKNTKLYAIWKR